MRVGVAFVGLLVLRVASGVETGGGDEEVEAKVVPVGGDVEINAKVVQVTRGGNATAPLFRDKVLVRTQLGCVRGSGPCDGIGKFLKSKFTLV